MVVFQGQTPQVDSTPIQKEREGRNMLILARHLGERIFIGPDIIITVTDIDRGKVRLGIEAPQEVRILREELLQREEAKEDQPSK